MIETYKLLSGKYDRSATPTLHVAGAAVTRGHNLTLHKFRARYDLRKYYFINRVVNIWNSLPSYVISAETVNCFKSRLDNLWKNQDIIYDYQSDIHGTGNRSETVVR